MTHRKKVKESRYKKALAIQALQKRAAKLGCRVTSSSGVTTVTLEEAIELLEEAIEYMPPDANATMSMSRDGTIKLFIKMM